MLVEHSPLRCRVMFVQDQVCTLMQCRKVRLLDGSELKHPSSWISLYIFESPTFHQLQREQGDEIVISLSFFGSVTAISRPRLCALFLSAPPSSFLDGRGFLLLLPLASFPPVRPLIDSFSRLHSRMPPSLSLVKVCEKES